MDKRHYTRPLIEVVQLDCQSIIAASDGQNMVNYSNDNGSVNLGNGDEITTTPDIW